MKTLILMATVIITVCSVSAFWLDYQANLQAGTKALHQEIDALLQERYEQRLEIAQYHRQETKLFQEISRLKRIIQTKPDPLNTARSVRAPADNGA